MDILLHVHTHTHTRLVLLFLTISQAKRALFKSNYEALCLSGERLKLVCESTVAGSIPGPCSLVSLRLIAVVNRWDLLWMRKSI